MNQKPVMDIIPWPEGEGFNGGITWWEYVLSQNEKDRLDSLMLAALISDEVCELLLKHDQALHDMFDLSPQTIALLSEIGVSTLEEFAQALINLSPPTHP